MSFLTSNLFYDLFLILAAGLTFTYLKFRLHSKYFWKRQNIPYIEPLFLFGNTLTANIYEPVGKIIERYYMENKEKPILGIWIYRKPTLMVQDLDLIKKILVKDFQYFHNRRSVPMDQEKDPLSANLFDLRGAKWKNLRVKLTPTFTLGKMKTMFPAIVDCGEELQKLLKGPADNEEVVEMNDILSRFNTDIISSCAFGIQTNSLRKPDSEFRNYGRKVAQPGIAFLAYTNILINFPLLQKLFPYRCGPKDVRDFFMNTVKEIIEHREKNNIQKSDFLDSIIQLKNKGKIESVDNDFTDPSEIEFTFGTAAAQVVAFFIAGFLSSSAAMTWAFYELSKNPVIQKKLQNEIDSVLSKHKNELSYEAIQAMEYLDMIINETLRKYPLPILKRECTKDYTFPGTDITIRKGTAVIIPTIGIQNDPQYFPNPEKFDPDRFSEEQKSTRDKFLHLPFGEGPRMCIGSRFGLLQIKVGLVSILSKYNVEVSDKTPIPIKMDPKSSILIPSQGMHLKITKRKER